MPNKKTLILLSILVAVAAGAAMYALSSEQLSSYGSITAAAGSLLAVVWFTGSLWYQSQQLAEQRTQFLAEFRQLREEGRRNALLLAREILSTAESRALQSNPKMESLSELIPEYVDFSDFNVILESTDPDTVQAAVTKFLRKDGAVSTVMRGIKSAAEVYFMGLGREDVDYTLDPEMFVLRYGSELWPIPFFDAFQSPAVMLADFMIRLEPFRKAAKIALMGVMVKTAGEEVLKMESIRQDIKEHIDNGYRLPEIAKGI